MGFASFCDQRSSVETSTFAKAVTVPRGPPVYVLHGRAYHVTGTLYPAQEEAPKYSQIYVHDPVKASEIRASQVEHLLPSILRLLHELLTENIPVTDRLKGTVPPGHR